MALWPILNEIWKSTMEILVHMKVCPQEKGGGRRRAIEDESPNEMR